MMMVMLLAGAAAVVAGPDGALKSLFANYAFFRFLFQASVFPVDGAASELLKSYIQSHDLWCT